MTLKVWLGVIVFIISFIGLCLNFLIFVPVFRLAFIAKKSSVYIIAFFNIISDLMQLSTICVYLAVSMIADDYVITGGRMSSWSIFFGWVFINAWYMECLVQIVMSTNRFTVITMNQSNIFTFKTTLMIFVLLISFTTFCAFCTQFFFPCCTFILDHQVMSVTFVNIPGAYSYSNLMLVTYDVICTTLPTLCYMSVFRTIRNASKMAATSNSQRARKQDTRYLLQFVFISVFYICTWVLFETLPYVVPEGQVQWFSAVPIFISLNASSNPVIYMTVNSEVQKALQIPWLRQKLIAAKPSTQTQSLPVNAVSS